MIGFIGCWAAKVSSVSQLSYYCLPIVIGGGPGFRRDDSVTAGGGGEENELPQAANLLPSHNYKMPYHPGESRDLSDTCSKQ
jgi:hypothetical protein